jgi:hypothetical protein
MAASEETYREALRDLRQALLHEEFRRVRIAGWGILAIALAVLVFLGFAIHGGATDKGPAWSLVALLGLAAVFVAVPLIGKINLSKDGGGIDFVSPIERIDRLEAQAQAARAESFEQTRLQISGLSQQIEALAAAVETLKPARNTEGETKVEEKPQAPAEPGLREIRRLLKPISDGDDQQKGRFDGFEARDGRRLKAEVSPSDLGKKWQKVTLTLVSENGRPLDGGYAYFFLHQTFDPDTYRVNVPPGAMQVSLETSAVGAFTAGVAAERGVTLLEVDLAVSPNVEAPKDWRER